MLGFLKSINNLTCDYFAQSPFLSRKKTYADILFFSSPHELFMTSINTTRKPDIQEVLPTNLTLPVFCP